MELKMIATLRSIIISLAIVVSLFSITAYAKRNSKDGARNIFIGIVQSMPSGGLHGDWIIGDNTFSTVPGTEFDQTDGPLAVNGCAKVEVRNGMVHEIDSEPLSDCK
jgi:hypothetical protein